MREQKVNAQVNPKTGLPETFEIKPQILVKVQNNSSEKCTFNQKITDLHILKKGEDLVTTKNPLLSSPLPHTDKETKLTEFQHIEAEAGNIPELKDVQPKNDEIDEKERNNKLLDVLSEKDIDYIQSQNMQILNKMAPQEIEQQQKLLLSLLSKQNIDFLKKNKNYYENRKIELKHPKETASAIQQPEANILPKKKSPKEVFLEKHAAANSMRKFLPGLSEEMFEEDVFDLYYYTCHYDNDGSPVKNLSTEKVAEYSNAFDGSKNDEFHTWSDLIDLTDSSHPGHVVFAFHKISTILETLVEKDADYVEAYPVHGFDRHVRLGKMRVLLGLFESVKLDQRLLFFSAKKNVNLISEVLVVTKLILRWLSNRMIAMSKLSPSVLAQTIKLVMGDDRTDHQIEIELLKTDFLTILKQIIESQEEFGLFGLLFEVHYYLRFMLPTNDIVSNITKVFMDKMRTSQELASLLSTIETKLDAQTSVKEIKNLDLTDVEKVFEQIALYRSNLKNGCKINSLSLEMLSIAFSTLTERTDIVETSLDLHTFASLAVTYLPQPPVHLYFSFMPVLHNVMASTFSLDEDLLKRLVYHIVSSEHFDSMQLSLSQKNLDKHFIKAKELYKDADSEIVYEGEGENRRLKIRPTLASFEYVTEELPDLLSIIIPKLSETEKMLVFFDIVRFFATDDTRPIMMARELVWTITRSMSADYLRKAIRHLAMNESLMKSLLENYKFCSYGESSFTSLLFLFASKYSKVELAK